MYVIGRTNRIGTYFMDPGPEIPRFVWITCVFDIMYARFRLLFWL